jgi:hypothetical protein
MLFYEQFWQLFPTLLRLAAASRASFFCPFKYGFTNWGAINRISWPNDPITRAQ